MAKKTVIPKAQREATQEFFREELRQLDTVKGRKRAILDVDTEILNINDMINKSGQKLTKSQKDVITAKMEEISLSRKINEQGEKELGSLKAKFGSIGKGMKKMVMGAKAFTRALLLNPAMAILAAVIAIGAFLVKMVKSARELQKEIGGTVLEAGRLALQIKAAQMYGRMLMLDAEEVKETFVTLAKTLGVVDTRTAMFSVHLLNASKRLGTTTDESIQLMTILSATERTTHQIALHNLRSLASMSEMKGIAPTAIFSELAQHANHFASYTDDSQKNLVKAVIQAKRLNVEFDSLVDLGDSLLDVSERIQKEQLLSSMLGRQIDLERFMALGVQDDLVGQQREFARIFADFGQQSATTQRMIAQALNMQTSEMVKWLAINNQTSISIEKWGRQTARSMTGS